MSGDSSLWVSWCQMALCASSRYYAFIFFDMLFPLSPTATPPTAHAFSLDISIYVFTGFLIILHTRAAAASAISQSSAGGGSV